MTHAIGYAPKVKENPATGLLDFTYTGGKMDVAENTDEVIQAIIVRLLKQRGEDWLDPDIGVPWRTLIGVPAPVLIRAEIVRALKNEPRIQSIDGVIVQFEGENAALGIATVSISVTLDSNESITITELFQL